MTIKVGLCFCRPGILSTCDPQGRALGLCDFWQKHSFIDRCTHLSPEIGNHCRCQEAQSYGYHPNGGGPKETLPPDIEESNQKLLDDLDEMLAEINQGPVPSAKPVRRTCLDCDNDPGCPMQPQYAHLLGKSLTSLTDQDYWTIASNCADFVPDGMGAASIP